MNRNPIIYVLHEYGAPSHYNGLKELGRQKGFDVMFRIFSPKQLCKLLIKGKILDFLNSSVFILSLPFRNPCKIVLGIAPYDWMLIPLKYLLKRHSVYYHTSYTHWGDNIMAHPTNSNRLKKFWKTYIKDDIKHIFSVSNKSKNELIANGYSIENNVSVVNHSYNTDIPITQKSKDNSFIFVGRLTASKGIEELIEIFSKRPHATLTLVGSGDLEQMVLIACRKYPNINYLGYISGINNLIPIYKHHSFLLLNSKRSNIWEELFGIAIIEGMACGCVPITTDHSGPKEIITSELNGYIAKENCISQYIDRAIDMADNEYQTLRNNAINKGQTYHCRNIATKWAEILN